MGYISKQLSDVLLVLIAGHGIMAFMGKLVLDQPEIAD